MTVKVIRFVSGENVVCDLEEETDDSVVIRDAIVAIPANQEGTQLAFAPFAPLQDSSETTLKIDKQFVMYIAKCASNLEDQYREMFNKPVYPEKKLIL
jgi:hypothetical protein|tara:strand:+ start:5532 stop:5825 length:294 start_codon:yes stop_codon:yes gene_type:complete